MGKSAKEGYVVGKALQHFLMASILTNVISHVRTMTDGVIVSNLIGPDALSAINIYLPLEEICEALIALLSVGAAFLGARALGKQDFHRTSRFFSLSMASTMAVVTLLVITVAFLINPVMSVLAGSGASEVKELATGYSAIMLASFFFLAANTILRYFINIDGNPKIVTFSILASFAINPVLDIIFIKTCHMGMSGAALASVISEFAGTCVLVGYYMSKRTSFRFCSLKGTASLLKPSLEAGAELAAVFSLIAVQNIALNRIILSCKGEDGLFIWAMAMQIFAFCEILVESFEEMNESVGAILLGSNDYKNYKVFVKKGLFYVLGALSVAALLSFCFPDAIFSIFDAGSEGTPQAAMTFRVIMLFIIPYFVVSLFHGIHFVMGHHALSASFVFTQAGMLILLPLLMGRVSAWIFWWAFPIAAFIPLSAQMAVSYHIGHKNKKYKAPILYPVVPVDVEANFNVNYTEESVAETKEKLRTIIDICELSDDKPMKMMLCCEELMDNILAYGSLHVSGENFEIRIVDKPEFTKVIIKNVGKPFNPVVKFDDTAYERFLKGEPMQLGLEIVNKFCDNIKYRYMFGINVTYLEFSKNS